MFVLFICALVYSYSSKEAVAPAQTEVISDTTKPEVAPAPTSKPTPEFVMPVAEFEKRITKKNFGTFITPATSPVQPERFSGYHTGIDIEYEDVTKEVSVRAITNGTVTYSGIISGYGGILMITHKIQNVPRTVVYGHLDPASLVAFGSSVKKNQVIAQLGDNKSTETDGERKHLHFAILSDTRIDFKGYVQEKSQLSGWLNPLSLY
jgi:murein DD-endopeptidase MepM/ murein hydrolase activator NlpD